MFNYKIARPKQFKRHSKNPPHLQDPESLAALAESSWIEANPDLSKGYRTVEELFADLDADDEDG